MEFKPTFNITDQNYHDVVRRLVTDERKLISKGTNLQNIPARTKEGVMIRKCFIPPEGHVLIGADLSQAEPRVEAHIMFTKYNDNSLRQIFVSGQDLYTSMAMLAFDLPKEYCGEGGWFDPVSKTGGTEETKDQAPNTAFFPRKMMKQGILALGYRQTEQKFAESMGVTLEVAHMVFEKFNKSFPSFNQMVEDTIEFMRINGYVETIFGRKRRFPEYKLLKRELALLESKMPKLYKERKKLLNQEGKPTPAQRKRFNQIQEELNEIYRLRGKINKIEREAFNAVIQGSATSDIIKLNGIEMLKVCKEKGWQFVATIHDEIIIAVPEKDVTPENVQIVQNVMCNTVKDHLTVPLKSDVVIMPRWMVEIKPHEWFAGKRSA